MIGFHLQGNVNDWPQAVAKLPKGAPVKFAEGVQRAREAKAHNPDVYTALRHVEFEQNLTNDPHKRAREFFATFIDESFRKEAPYVDAVHEWNEYFANSQGDYERNKWIEWASACVDVWRDDYRTQADYAHIELIIAETAVGNDIPWQLAKLSHDYSWVILGYHPYTPVWNKVIRPDDWTWYSGRWEQMDKRFMEMGYKPRWFFGEGGAVGHTSGPQDGNWPNALNPNGGWRLNNVYNKDKAAYLNMMGYWMGNAVQSQAYREGRVIGMTLFTSGGGSRWEEFEIQQPFLGEIADYVSAYMANVPDPEEPDNPEDPDPEDPGECRGAPREQYGRTYIAVPQHATRAEWDAACDVAFENKQTVGFSYDDAGIGDLDRRLAICYGLTSYQRGEYVDWFAEHYPGVVVEFQDYPETGPGPVPTPGMVIDVSHWQGKMDWQQAANAGVVAAYIKCTEGRSYKDDQFDRNWQGAKAAGIRRGAYCYYLNHQSPEEQAAYFMECLPRTDLGELPPALDVEDTSSIASPPDIQEWLEIVEDELDIEPAIYTAAWYWNNHIAPTDWAGEYELWVANWGDREDPLLPTDWDDWWLWQYDESGSGAEYGAQSTYIDLNRFNEDRQ